MLASASGPLGALLLIAPLAAIPVFAVVGLPHFAPVAASPADDEEISDIADAPPLPSTSRPASRRTADDLFAPIGVPSDSRSPGSRATGGVVQTREIASAQRGESFRGGAAPILPPEALDDWEVATNIRGNPGGKNTPQPSSQRDEGLLQLRPEKQPGAPAAADPPRESNQEAHEDSSDIAAQRNLNERSPMTSMTGSRSPRDFNPDLLQPVANSPPRSASRDARNAPGDNRALTGQARAGIPEQIASNEHRPAMPEAPEQSGWRTAARRLKEMGIRKYRLESQIEEQQFLFRCEYPTPETPQVTELFEAVADTPLDAVLEALRQIDEWLERDPQSAETAGD